MNDPNFELAVRIKAQSLRSRTAPNAVVDSEGVKLERREERNGLPPHLEPATDYTHVVVEKRLRGGLVDQAGDDPSLRQGVARDDADERT